MAAKTTNDFIGTGRRKTSVARVRLATGSGKITVNGRAFENYFPLETLRSTAAQPLAVTSTTEKIDANINVSGGGPNGQAGAVSHGIARALLKFDANLRPQLKAEVRPAGREKTVPILETLIALEISKTPLARPAGFFVL
jgi:small subunit ribosomal protein S9